MRKDWKSEYGKLMDENKYLFKRSGELQMEINDLRKTVSQLRTEIGLLEVANEAMTTLAEMRSTSILPT